MLLLCDASVERSSSVYACGNKEKKGLGWGKGEKMGQKLGHKYWKQGGLEV